MKTTDFIKAIPAGSPAGEILKIAALIAATVLVDKIGDVVKEVIEESQTPLIDVTYKEEK